MIHDSNEKEEEKRFTKLSFYRLSVRVCQLTKLRAKGILGVGSIIVHV